MKKTKIEFFTTGRSYHTTLGLHGRKFIHQIYLTNQTNAAAAYKQTGIMKNEIWKNIEGWEGKYQVSDKGSIKSFFARKEKILTPGISGVCLKVALCDSKRGILKNYKVHRLVAIAFIPNPLNKPKINHKDNDWTNNKVENLEWCTQAENVAHCIKQNRQAKGEQYPHTKLTAKKVLNIRSLYKKGNSMISLASKYGVTRETIRRAINKIDWKHI